MISLPATQIDDVLLSDLAHKYGMKELYLFGSVLREDFSEESDIDILVVFTESVDYDYIDIFHIKEEFSRVLGRPVDLVEKKAVRNPFRREDILASAKKVYAA